MNIIRENAVVKTYNQLSKLPLGSIRAKGWMRDQLLRSKNGMGGHLDELEPDMIGKVFINYSAFKRLPYSDKDADPTFAAGWSSEISGTYWTGLVQLAFTLNDDELIRKAETWVDGVLKHQEPDGYLGGYPPYTNRMADYNSWGSAWCYRALLSFYEATGRKEVLEAVHRGLVWFCENWKNNKTDYVGSIIIEPMCIVYAYTGDERLPLFCYDWLNWLEKNSRWQNKITQYQSDDLPYNSMHCVAYGEDVKHPAILYCVTDDKKMLRASLNGMRKALERIIQITGGPSSCSEYLSPKGSVCETEYCNFTTFNHSYSWLALATGDAKWGDWMERCVFNGAQGARKKDERAIAYFTAPNEVYATRDSIVYGGHADMGAYAPCYGTACCPAQSVRMLPEFIRSMVMRDASGELCIFGYGPVSVTSERMDFEMDTLYPFRDTVTLRISRAEGESLRLRIPGWCKAPTVQVNGREVGLIFGEKGFAKLACGLNSGDTVVIRFPMEVSLTRVDDSAAGSRFPICVERGPLVYALPIETNWVPYPGNPITKLPEGWSWFEAFPVDPEKRKYWGRAIDEMLDPAEITVEERETDGYVWEDPPVALHVPLYPAPHAITPVGKRTFDAWESPVRVTGDTVSCTMVPHGCTNLRITYLPRATKKQTVQLTAGR